MREILFRGKRKDNGNWVEGYLTKNTILASSGNTVCASKGAYVAYTISEDPKDIFDGGCYEVIPETVGQYTGLKDKNGKKIFEGDICSFVDFHSGSDSETYCEGIWCFDNGQFYITDRLSCDTDDLVYDGLFDGYIIGNIHDNPELLKGV